MIEDDQELVEGVTDFGLQITRQVATARCKQDLGQLPLERPALENPDLQICVNYP